jgi:PleD family two-component response regulator
VEVPLLRISLAEMKDIHNSTSTKNDVGAVSLQGLKILIVDDSAMNRKLMNRTLARKGHECDEAEDGQVLLNFLSIYSK